MNQASGFTVRGRSAQVRGAARHATLYILAAALAAGLGLWAAERHFAPPPPAPPMQAVTLLPAPRALTPFTLRTANDAPITPAWFQGHWTLVYLGYTHCPDVCPTTLQMLGVASRAWSTLPQARRPRILFVSVDPGRDSPEHTAQYAHYFGKDITGATADAATLQKFAHALGVVYFVKPSAKASDYQVDHSAAVPVLDPQGHMAGLITPAPPPAQPFDPKAIGADLQTLARWR